MTEAQQLADALVRRASVFEGVPIIDVTVNELRRLDAENGMLKSHLQFVERWANHHATKPHVTAEQALSVIQHFPAIKSITHGYADGKVPDTHDPYAELRRLDAVNAQMLEALKAIVDADFFPGAWTEHYEALAQKARAAIAAATGETK